MLCYVVFYILFLLLDESELSKEGTKLLLSDLLSRYAMFPILGLETLIYLPMNIFLLCIWYREGEFLTVVNKIIGIQRVCGILYSAGCFLDYFFRVYGIPISSDSLSTLCSCWMIYYKLLVYAYHTSHLSIALVRFFSVKYPIEYHIR